MSAADTGAGDRRPLDDDLIAAIAADLAAAYATDGQDSRSGVALVAGAGVKLSVRYGHLVVEDGLGSTRRTRRFPRVPPSTAATAVTDRAADRAGSTDRAGSERLSRLIVEAGSGYVTLDALEWCQATGVSVVGLDRDGEPAWSTFTRGPSDARLTRALAAAGMSDTDPVGIAIVTGLLRIKLTGQADLAGFKLGRPDLAGTVTELMASLELVGSVDEARQVEASAAALYWSAWSAPGAGVATAPRLNPADRRKVPAGWAVYPGRRSQLGAEAANRRATHPTNAMLNYCHTLARVEATRALCRLGLDPSLGVLHRDMARRDSLACDLQEAVRPAVESYVLDLLAARTFKRADFLEGPAGEVRLGVSLRAELAATSTRWEREVAPYAEALRRVLTRCITEAGSSRSVPLGTAPLTGAARKAAARDVTERKAAARAAKSAASKVAMTAIRPRSRAGSRRRSQASLWSCPDCGREVTEARRVRCERCIAADPRQTPALRASRAQAISGRRQAEAGWNVHHPAGLTDPAWWEQTLCPALAGLPLPAIIAATGVAKSTASGWRSGRHVPHPMHWATLAGLAGVRLPAGSQDLSAAQPMPVDPQPIPEPVETYR